MYFLSNGTKNKLVKSLNYFLRPNSLSRLTLDFTTTQSSTVSGLRQALLAVTVFPATLNTLSLLELATGTAKVTLTR